MKRFEVSKQTNGHRGFLELFFFNVQNVPHVEFRSPHPVLSFEDSLENSHSFSVFSEQKALNIFHSSILVFGNKSKTGDCVHWDKPRPSTQDCWAACTSPSGLVTAKMYMTSHSAEDKAHWFLLDREVGVAVRARTSKRGRKMWTCRWVLLLHYVSVYVCICLCVWKSSISIHVRQLVESYMHVSYSECRCLHVWLMCMSMPSCPTC